MKDIRNDYFMTANFTADELEILWGWIQEGGNKVVIKEPDDAYIAVTG